jgi:hypothetical protein
MLSFLKQHGTLIVIILALFAGLAWLLQSNGTLVPPIEQMKTDCHAPDQHVEYDCLVASYTQMLARLTLWLVAATAFLGLATFIAAMAAKAAADHIPNVERAFIHGGVHPKGRAAINGRRDIRIRFSMANYGKTPGFIKYIKFGSCKLEDLPDDPDYRVWKDHQVLDLYFPQMTMKDVRTDTAEILIPADGKHVVFQRVYYDDVFNKSHSSGSVHRMYLDKKGVVKDEIVSGKPAYWKWD